MTGNQSTHTNHEIAHLNEYCKKLSDTKLLAHLHKARDQYYLLKSLDVEEREADEWQYETKEYKIRRVPHVAESRWGVYVKSMDRYGMWGVFADEKTYTRFYVADEKFNEDYLDNLHIRICVDANEYSSIESEKW